MIWFSFFGRWSSASGPLFIRKRIYWSGFRWTPFVRVFWRYCKKDEEIQKLDFRDFKNKNGAFYISIAKLNDKKTEKFIDIIKNMNIAVLEDRGNFVSCYIDERSPVKNIFLFIDIYNNNMYGV